jgi:hypothetical protein
MSGNEWRTLGVAYGVLAVVGWLAAPSIARWFNVPRRTPWYHWRRVVYGAVLFPLLSLAVLALVVAGAMLALTHGLVRVVRGVLRAGRAVRPASDAGATRGGPT